MAAPSGRRHLSNAPPGACEQTGVDPTVSCAHLLLWRHLGACLGLTLWSQSLLRPEAWSLWPEHCLRGKSLLWSGLALGRLALSRLTLCWLLLFHRELVLLSRFLVLVFAFQCECRDLISDTNSRG